jgi:hypothetical protein
MPESWWKDDYNSSWERTKEAFRRDWEQTKHDFGGDAADLNQNVADTVKQAAGKEAIPAPGAPNFDENEPAFLYGHGARLHYGTRKWDDAFEAEISKGYTGDWTRDRDLVRSSYDYRLAT